MIEEARCSLKHQLKSVNVIFRHCYAAIFFLNRLVWIDAHPDINTPDSSTTGNCHGMPVAYLLSLVEWFRMPEPRLKPHEVVYIGLVRGKKI